MSHLKLVPTAQGIAPTEAAGVLHARPADRTETWTPRAASGKELARAAARVGLDPNLAAVLVVERALIEAEHGERHEGIDLPRLDSLAAAAQVNFELSGASADYLRALGRPAETPSPPLVAIRLPMRLGERVLRFGVDPLLRPEVLSSALGWERASVLAGLTMTEWALLELGGAG
jgi:hypothetical protein